MSESKPFAGRQLRPADFIKFKADLELLLTVFTAQTLANWMGKDKGNFSKRLNGIDPITAKFLAEFYRKLGPVINRIKQGAASFEVEDEMTKQPAEETPFIKYRVEIVELQTGAGELRVKIHEMSNVLAEHDNAIKRLEAAVFGPEGPQKALTA